MSVPRSPQEALDELLTMRDGTRRLSSLMINPVAVAVGARTGGPVQLSVEEAGRVHSLVADAVNHGRAWTVADMEVLKEQIVTLITRERRRPAVEERQEYVRRELAAYVASPERRADPIRYDVRYRLHHPVRQMSPAEAWNL